MKARGTVQVPGDKSISHRYAMLGGIAEGETKLALPVTDRLVARETDAARRTGHQRDFLRGGCHRYSVVELVRTGVVPSTDARRLLS